LGPPRLFFSALADKQLGFVEVWHPYVEATLPYTGSYDGDMLAYGMWDESSGVGDWWYQMLDEVIVEGDEFTLTFAYGPTSVDMLVTASFVYDNGPTLVEIASTVVSSGTSKQLADYTLVFNAQAGQAYIGENIGVKFAMGNGPQGYDSWASVDNVRVELVIDEQDSDLVGWWELDETSGTSAYDSTDNGNDGTVEGGGGLDERGA
jgi:hypothetical protein